ncbi:hypothetical protein J6590_000079 [Homalodisca vitripennis]|nr:hypothetical protein J6590_000079 [Homalodisca vitripennis]
MIVPMEGLVIERVIFIFLPSQWRPVIYNTCNDVNLRPDYSRQPVSSETSDIKSPLQRRRKIVDVSALLED